MFDKDDFRFPVASVLLIVGLLSCILAVARTPSTFPLAASLSAAFVVAYGVVTLRR